MFPTFRGVYDPESEQPLTLRIDLRSAGDSITSAQVDLVDAQSVAPLADAPLVLGPVTVGLIFGTEWGITVWARGKTASAPALPFDVYLRFRYTRASGRKRDRTMRLQVAQQ